MQTPKTQYLQIPKLSRGKYRFQSRSWPRLPDGRFVASAACSKSLPFSMAADASRQRPAPDSGSPRGLNVNGACKRQAKSCAVEPMVYLRTSVPQTSGIQKVRDHYKQPSILQTASLQQRLVGTWRLESYISYPSSSSKIQRPTCPLTRNVTGFIMYTPDGYMLAQMLIPGQKKFERGAGDEQQWCEAAERFFAYFGPYYISDEGPGRRDILRHTFPVCNLPGWIGDVQIRTYQFEDYGDVLVLGSECCTSIKVLSWASGAPRKRPLVPHV